MVTSKLHAKAFRATALTKIGGRYSRLVRPATFNYQHYARQLVCVTVCLHGMIFYFTHIWVFAVFGIEFKASKPTHWPPSTSIKKLACMRLPTKAHGAVCVRSRISWALLALSPPPIRTRMFPRDRRKMIDISLQLQNVRIKVCGEEYIFQSIDRLLALRVDISTSVSSSSSLHTLLQVNITILLKFAKLIKDRRGPIFSLQDEGLDTCRRMFHPPGCRHASRTGAIDHLSTRGDSGRSQQRPTLYHQGVLYFGLRRWRWYRCPAVAR